MKRFYLACIGILMVITSFAQDSMTLKKVTYKSVVTFTDKRVAHDYLVDITDTSLLTVRLPAKFRREGMYVQSTPVPYMQIGYGLSQAA